MPGKAGEGAAEVEIELQVDGDDEFGEEDGACDAEAAAVQANLCVRRVHLVGGACTVLCLAAHRASSLLSTPNPPPLSNTQRRIACSTSAFTRWFASRPFGRTLQRLMNTFANIRTQTREKTLFSL